MIRGILIALVVAPMVVSAAPRKKPRGKKADKPKVEEPADAPEPAPTPPPATTPTTTAAPAGTTPPATTPTVPPNFNPATPTTSAPPPQTGATSTPAPSTTTDAPPADVKEADVDSLRQEYLALRDELFKSRARANAVAGQLYSTRMTIKFTWGSARHYGVSKASIRLDGATVYEDATGAIAGDDGIRFDGYVAPGKHLVTFHVEATGKDDDSFTSTTETQVTVKAVANKDLVVAAKGRDSGDIAYAWKRSEKGNYGLGIDVNVKSVASGTAAAAKGSK